MFMECDASLISLLHFHFADERDDISKVDSDKFNTMIEEVDNLHQLGNFCCLLFSSLITFVYG